MDQDFITRISQTIQNQDDSDWVVAANIFELLFSWYKNALERMRGDRPQLIIGFSKISNALIQGTSKIENISDLISIADPGVSIERKIALADEKMKGLTREVDTLRENLVSLEDKEQKNRDLLNQKEELEGKLSRYTGLSTCDPKIITELRNQVDIFEKSKPWLIQADQLRSKLSTEIPIIKTLTGESLVALDANCQEELRELQRNIDQSHTQIRQSEQFIEKLHQEASELVEELAKKQQEYEIAEKLINERREILQQYFEADKEIARAIDNQESNNAKEMLDQIEAKLEKVDDALSKAISANERNQKLRKIPL